MSEQRFTGVAEDPQEETRAQRYAIGSTYATPAVVNRGFELSAPLRRYYDQGNCGACVAFSASQLMTVLNEYRTYHTGWLFVEARGSCQSGTVIQSALTVLRDKGHVPHWNEGRGPVTSEGAGPAIREEGINDWRWFAEDPDVALDQIRATIASGAPVVIATPWYMETFGYHNRDGGTWLHPAGDDWGPAFWQRHAYLIDGAFDSGRYLTTPNSWGWDRSVRIGYDAFRRLWLGEEGTRKGSGYAVIDYAPFEPTDPETGDSAKKWRCPICRKRMKSSRRKRHLTRHRRKKRR